MKFIIQLIILILCLHITVLSLAQKKVNIDSEEFSTMGKERVPIERNIEFRFLIGSTFSTNGSNAPTDPFLGFHGGIGAAYYFRPSLKIRLGFEYRNNNELAGSCHGSIPSNVGWSLSYISVPLLFEKQLKRWALFLGPSINYLEDSKQSFCSQDWERFLLQKRYYFGTHLGMSYNLIQSYIYVKIEGHIKKIKGHYLSPGLALVTTF